MGSHPGWFSTLSCPLPGKSLHPWGFSHHLVKPTLTCDPYSSFIHSPFLSSLHPSTSQESIRAPLPEICVPPKHRYLYHFSRKAATTTQLLRPVTSNHPGVLFLLPPINKTTAPQTPAPMSRALLPPRSFNWRLYKESQASLYWEWPGAQSLSREAPSSRKLALMPQHTPEVLSPPSLHQPPPGQQTKILISPRRRMGVFLAYLPPLSLRAEL